MNLISEYKCALQICESDLIKKSKERQYQGMERVYHIALMEVLEHKRKFIGIRREVLLEDIGGRVVDDRSRGYVDIVIEGKNSNVHAIELKVVQLPREKNLSPMQSLYDIGQIAGDFLRLKRGEEAYLV